MADSYVLDKAYGTLQMPGYTESWYEDIGTGAINNPSEMFASLLNEQRAYNQLQMEREDTAYQRMVADMKKAGLNPWTGISSGGSSSSSLVAPQKSALEGMLNILGYNVNRTDKRNKQMNDAISTGLKIALPILAMFGA